MFLNLPYLINVALLNDRFLTRSVTERYLKYKEIYGAGRANLARTLRVFPDRLSLPKTKGLVTSCRVAQYSLTLMNMRTDPGSLLPRSPCARTEIGTPFPSTRSETQWFPTRPISPSSSLRSLACAARTWD